LFLARTMESPEEQEYRRGNALHGAGDSAGALAAYDAALRLQPGHPAAGYNRAAVLIQLQRWQEALEGLDALVRIHPRMADAWNNRSGVLQALGRFDEALESLKPVLQLRPFD